MKPQLKEMILISIFAALMVVGAKLSIPTPFGVPLTFQLFFAIYAGLLLTARNALFSQLIYILLGLIGLPVFAYGGGLPYIFNPTFGYILGFALTAFVIGYLMNGMVEIKLTKVLIICLIGYVLTYIVGNVYFYLIKNLYLDAPISLLNIFTIMIPYMIKDLVLLVTAAYSATIVIPVLRKAGHITVRKQIAVDS